MAPDVVRKSLKASGPRPGGRGGGVGIAAANRASLPKNPLQVMKRWGERPAWRVVKHVKVYECRAFRSKH